MSFNSFRVEFSLLDIFTFIFLLLFCQNSLKLVLTTVETAQSEGNVLERLYQRVQLYCLIEISPECRLTGKV